MRDETKRAKVRRMLRAKKWQAASDREVARGAEVGRFLVRSVRGELVAAGLIPRPEPGPYTPESVQGKLFRPGTVARGGYVFDELGKVVPKEAWLRKQKAKRAAER